MIPIKTKKEIQIMHEGGRKLSSTLGQLLQLSKPGVNLLEIEKKAVQLLKAAGGEPGFARVPHYHWATCLNVNEEIVHGVPKDYVLKPGDVLNIDIGLYYKGFNTDMSTTLRVESQKSTPGLKQSPCFKPGSSDFLEPGAENIDKFLKAGKKALEEATKQAKPGNRVGHISQKIQEIIEGNGYGCARNLTGHGIGRKLHEPPAIPCFLKEPIEQTPLLKTGMTIAIEVIYTLGEPDLVVSPKDKWTIRTKDGKLSAVFEQTINITKNKPLILTPLKF